MKNNLPDIYMGGFKTKGSKKKNGKKGKKSKGAKGSKK